MKAILISKQELLHDILSIMLEGFTETELSLVESVAGAQFELKASEKGVDVLMIDIESGDRFDPNVVSALTDTKRPIVMLAGTNTDVDQDFLRTKNCHLIYKPVHLDSLISLLQTTLPHLFTVSEEQYCRVKLETLLLSGNLFDFDAYIKISDSKFTKVLNKGDKLSIADYAEHPAKKWKHLYLKKEDFLQFLRKFAEELQKLLSDESEVFSVESAVELSTNIHEVLYESIPEMGMTEHLQKVTKASVDLALASIRKDPKISELLSVLTDSQAEYINWHSTALCYVGCMLSSKMTWDSENTHFKIALASLLHDITVRDHGIALLCTTEDLEKIKDESERNAYRQHPLMAASLAQNMKDFPGDVDYIVAQHHEMPDGSGFPLGLNHTKISPFSALFIVAHDLTRELYLQRKEFNLADYTKRAAQKFDKGYFKKIIAQLEKLVELSRSDTA